jgi:hypothetical protein|tara:strand:- start:89 stop:433 length:345 start_codon:yes stop_codon:yes gene_type:complete
VKAAVDPAAKASVKMEEAAPAVMGGDGQWPAVLGLGWWPVAAMAEMAGEKAASTMSEAVAAMVVVAAGTNRNVLGGFTTFVMLQEQNRFAASTELLRYEYKLCVCGQAGVVKSW